MMNLIGKIIYKIKNHGKTHGVLSYDDAFQYLGKDEIAIDCGANVGEITERMNQRGAIVYAFEPNPYAFEILKEKFKNNPKVFCLNKGVFIKEGKERLYLHQKAGEDQIKWSVGSSLLSFKGNVDENNFIEIEVIDLADFIKRLNKKIGVLKMDIEGAECEVINHLINSGAISMIKRMVVELHDKGIPEIRFEAEKLKQRITREKVKGINFNWA
jgi:FkbM family methyltransferase